jgi:hypothetical protein
MTSTIQICQQRPTLDAAFSDAAVKALQCAVFAPGHRALCDCLASGGKIEPKDCNGIRVFDAKDAEVAHFSGKGFHARPDSEGRIVVFRLPVGGTQDSGKLTLKKLNEWHLEFYKRGTESW